MLEAVWREEQRGGKFWMCPVHPSALLALFFTMSAKKKKKSSVALALFYSLHSMRKNTEKDKLESERENEMGAR